MLTGNFCITPNDLSGLRGKNALDILVKQWCKGSIEN
jgi:hypothetical protein